LTSFQSTMGNPVQQIYGHGKYRPFYYSMCENARSNLLELLREVTLLTV